MGVSKFLDIIQRSSAVKHPTVHLQKDGVFLNPSAIEHLESIDYLDCIDDEADDLTLSFSDSIALPQKGDKIKAWIGFNDLIPVYIGEFYVTGWTEKPHEGKIIITFCPIDFSTAIKQKRTASYDDISLTNLLKLIAKRHNLKVINDLTSVAYTHKAQTNESDLSFLKRLADENNATFALKNSTIIMRKKSMAKDKNLPKVTINYADISNLELTYQDKQEYNSGRAKYHCSARGELVTITVGEGEAELIIEGSFKSEAEARERIIAELEKENSGQIRGGFSATTQELVAGTLLQLIMPTKIVDDLQISEVRHSVDTKGYIKKVKFTK